MAPRFRARTRLPCSAPGLAQATHVAVLIAALLCIPLATAGKLSSVRKAARGSSSSSSSAGSSGSSSGGGRRSSHGRGLPPILLCATAVGALFCLPRLLLEPSPRKVEGRPAPRRHARLLAYPYAEGRTGNMVVELVDPEEHTTPHKPRAHRLAQVRLSTEYALDWEGVHMPSAHLQVDTHYRLGLETRWTQMMERLDDGSLDRLTMGDGTLFYRFAQHPLAAFRAGLGLRGLFDSQEYFLGFNFAYGVDLFPVRPLVVSAEAHLGNLGEAFFFQTRATVGVVLNRFELYAGYQASLIHPVWLHGPVAGVRVWF